MKNKLLLIFLNAVPIILMIALIPFIKNDYMLAFIYIIIIAISFIIEYKEKEIIVFIFGFFIMIIAEYFFVSTGVETFVRNSLFNIMPLWLPFLWAYSFVGIKRAIKILDF